MSSFLFGTLAVFVDVLFPGPNFVITTSVARKCGKQAAMSMLAGILLACAVWCIFLFFGSVFLFVKYPILKISIKIIGAIYILRLAIRMLLVNLRQVKTSDGSSNNLDSESRLSYFKTGFVNCILNPEVGLFYMIMFSRIIDAYGHGNLVLFLFSLEFILIQFVCFYFFISIFSRSSQIFGRYVKYLDVSLSIILIILWVRLSKGIVFDVLRLVS